MSTLTAALTAAVLTTPVVQVTHDRIVELSRQAEITIQPGASNIGIDNMVLNEFIVRTSQRYTGTQQ